MTHKELCILTAKRFIKDGMVALIEYQSYATGEFPDVLIFSLGYTTLFEIKTSKADFLKDNQKDCRKKYKSKLDWFLETVHKKCFVRLKAEYPELFFIQAPHLGRKRYYVCEPELIQPNEVKNGWGLYWFKNKKFHLKKISNNFQRDIHSEITILTHAFRKYSEGEKEQILVNGYRRRY